MTDYKTVTTNVIPEITTVRFYEETVEHIKENHPEIPIEFPSVREAVTNAIVKPTRVEKSYGSSYVFVDAESTNSAGDPLRVPVRPVEGTSGRVSTAYFASTTTERPVVWEKKDD